MNSHISRKPSSSVITTDRSPILQWIDNHYFIPATLAPALLILFAFVYLPTVYSFFLSLFKTKLFNPVQFVGFGNYLYLLKDAIFWKALRNTAVYSIGSVLGTIVCGLVLALILDSDVKGKDIFRTAFFIPYILPYTAFTLLWYWMLDPRYGLVNYVLGFLSIKAIPWLTSSSWVIPAFIMMDIWKRAGFAMVLFLAGLQTIPDELYDAATVDGAGDFAKFKEITLPLLSPVTLFVIIMSFLHTFQLFAEPFIMTKGGPNNASSSLVYLMYIVGFNANNVGRSSAIAVILFVIILVLTLFLIRRFDIRDIYS